MPKLLEPLPTVWPPDIKTYLLCKYLYGSPGASIIKKTQTLQVTFYVSEEEDIELVSKLLRMKPYNLSKPIVYHIARKHGKYPSFFVLSGKHRALTFLSGLSTQLRQCPPRGHDILKVRNEYIKIINRSKTRLYQIHKQPFEWTYNDRIPPHIWRDDPDTYHAAEKYWDKWLHERGHLTTSYPEEIKHAD